MGAFTPINQVWYPDEDDTAEQNVNMATMASSIEDGVGARLKHQEIAVGLKGSVNTDGWTIPANNALTLVPYVITPSRGDFTQGLTITAGVVTVATAGMYLFTATLGSKGSVSGIGIKLSLERNGALIANGEVGMVYPIWGSTSATTVLNCVAGDTLRVKGCLTGTTNTMTNEASSTHISIAMVQALPL